MKKIALLLFVFANACFCQTSFTSGIPQKIDTSATFIAKTMEVGKSNNVNFTVNGKIKIVDGTQGAGKALISDANGIGTWTTISSGGGGVQLSGDNLWTGNNSFQNSINVGGSVFAKSNSIRNVIINSVTPGWASNTSDTSNVVIGHNSSLGNYSKGNIVIGHDSFLQNGINQGADAINNIAIGNRVLQDISNGDGWHIAIGHEALRDFQGQGVSNNLAIGHYSMQKNNSVDDMNTAIGHWSLRNGITPYGNTVLGFSAMKNSDGDNNVAIGLNSLGNSNYSSSSIAIGNYSMFNNQGFHNVAIGYTSLSSSGTGSQNVAVGSSSLESLQTGSSNVAIGWGTGADLVTGDNNTIIGYNGIVGANLNNTVIIGTGNVERLRINSSGNLGVGTSSPTNRLSVSGGTSITNGWTRTASFHANYPVLILNSTASSKYAGIGYDGSSSLYFWVNGSSEDISGTGIGAMTIKSSNGNVGIGIGTAEQKLHVEGLVKIKAYTTSEISSFSGMTIGTITMNSTIGLPVFYNGTTWKRFDGSNM